MVCDLTGLALANASLLDEATAAAEAMAVARRASKAESDRFVVDSDVFPQTLAVLRTRAEPIGIEIVVADLAEGLPAGGCFGALTQYPAASGRVRDLTPLIEEVHAAGALACVAADLLALVLLTPPGEMGADVVVGTSQRFGVPIGFGGPHAAYMSGARDSSARCPAGSSASRSTPTETPRCGSRCRRASSTSAARRRPPTSARRRCCLRSWPRCTPSTTAARGSS